MLKSILGVHVPFFASLGAIAEDCVGVGRGCRVGRRGWNKKRNFWKNVWEKLCECMRLVGVAGARLRCGCGLVWQGGADKIGRNYDRCKCE